MAFELLPFLSFAIPTSITPGPNNISSMAFCMQKGYKQTLPYLLGIATGTFAIMMICAWLSFGLAGIVPQLTTYLKYLGAAYILYLAYKTMRLSVDKKANEKIKARYIDGAMLQLVNPKAIFYGMTVYSTFFASLVEKTLWLSLSALILAIYTFGVVSLWGLSGATIKRYLQNQIIKTIFTVIMVGGLIYAAVDIVFA